MHHAAPENCWGPQMMSRHLWLDANVRGGGGGGGAGGEQRAKYKSSYMKRNFTSAEVACFYKYSDADDAGSGLEPVDSVGGFVWRSDE